MDLQLREKVVLVTGGASGIGAAIARSLIQEGATAVIVDRCEEAARALQSELEAGGDSVVAIGLDVTSVENCRHAVDQTIRQFHRLDALVNNAGGNDRVGLERGTPEE